MARYGMTLEVYDVAYGDSKDINADVVTFGTAKDMPTFQQFFQDPELHEIMPMLEQSLNSHQVIFTSGSLEKQYKSNANTLLSLLWFKGDHSNASESVAMLTNKVTGKFFQYGVQKLTTAQGLMSNKGLGTENEQTLPPQQVELWSMTDAHGYFDDPQVINIEKKVKNYTSRSDNFWLKPRLIN